MTELSKELGYVIEVSVSSLKMLLVCYLLKKGYYSLPLLTNSLSPTSSKITLSCHQRMLQARISRSPKEPVQEWYLANQFHYANTLIACYRDPSGLTGNCPPMCPSRLASPISGKRRKSRALMAPYTKTRHGSVPMGTGDDRGTMTLAILSQ